MLRFLYKTALGRSMLKVLCQPNISIICGNFLDSAFSKKLIPSFVRKKGIDLNEYEADHFTCFNDCFCRKIKPGLRDFPKDEEALCAPCDGLLSLYRIHDLTVLPVKQSRYTIPSLLQDEKLAGEFADGYCLVYRLCVNHYHRYSFFDSGSVGENKFIPGILHTVRPIALESVPVFVQNAREMTVLHTDHFGKAVQVEVGALLVGKIVNDYDIDEFVRGQEKGYFIYGGSTVVLLLKKDSVELLPEVSQILDTGIEMPVKLGEQIGKQSK